MTGTPNHQRPQALDDPSRVQPAYHDGLRLLEHRWTTEQIQFLFSAKPTVSPSLLAARAKGRLDHALRAANLTEDFSRKVAVRSVGENTRMDLEAYLQRQVSKEHFVDARFERDSCLRIARKKGYAISSLSVMPDHLHVALRGNPEHNPNEIVYAFQNNVL